MVLEININTKLPIQNEIHIESERTLIDGLKRQDHKICTSFYKAHSAKMMTIASRYTSSREDATEVVNNAFMKAIKSIGSYQPQGKIDAWLSVIVKRTAIDYCRKYTYNKPTKVEVQDIDYKVYNEAMNSLREMDFLELLQKVPPSSRTVFNLFAIEGYSHKEISKTLGISEGTSKWHLSNARKVLIEQLKSKNYEI